MNKTSRDDTRNTHPPVSVIIATYNREEPLCDTLHSLLKQDYPNFEIIVVDQTATHLPTTKQLLEKLQSDGKIKYIFSPTPNTPKARNTGLKTAKGDVIIFVDDDVDLSTGFIDNHVKNYNDPKIGAVAGKVIPSPPIENPDAWRCKDPIKDWWWFKCDWDKRIESAFAGGCNMSMRASAINSIGSFDENYVNECWGEETDPCFRLRKKGFTIIYDPSAALTHFKVAAGGSRAKRKDQTLNISLYRNVTYFFLKNLAHRDLLKHFVLAYRCYVGQEKNRILKSPAVFGRFLKRNFAYTVGFVMGIAALAKTARRN